MKRGIYRLKGARDNNKEPGESLRETGTSV